VLYNFQNRAYKKALTARLDGSRPDIPMPRGAAAERAFNKTLFTLMGCLANLSGVESAYPPREVRAVMRTLDLDARARDQAVADFATGRLPVTDIMFILERLLPHIGKRSKLSGLFVQVLCQISLAKGNTSVQERRMLRDVAEYCGYSKAEFIEICAGIQKSASVEKISGSHSVNSAFKVLQLEPGATDVEIRRAYLRLVSSYHPDKLLKQNLSEDVLKAAKEKFAAVSNAYHFLCRSRKLSA
jgi:DnaJ like chaperone protein